MKRIRQTSSALRSRRALVVVLLASGIAAYLACSDDSTRYQPLAPENPGVQHAIVAGDVHSGPDMVKGAVVTIEALTNGVPATLAALQSRALADGRPAAPTASAAANQRTTLTDDRGRFVFDDVPAGDYALAVRANNHLGASQQVQVPASPALLDTIVVDVNLTATGTFSGVALLEDASAHSNTIVYAEGTSYLTVTAPDGSYSMTDVPVGSYNIRATHTHYLDDTTMGTLTTAGETVVLSGMLLKVNANIPPVPTIDVASQPTYPGLPISFTGGGNDPDGSIVQTAWDFDNDGVVDTVYAGPPAGVVQHAYSSAGTYVAKLRLTDNEGAIGIAAATVVIGPILYVSATGNDGNAGTSSGAPLATLAHAFLVAQSTNSGEIHMAVGSYNEAPHFVNGINIYGGYNATTWVPDAGYTSFYAGETRATADGITISTSISRIMIYTSTPTSLGNSIALGVTGSTAALSFSNCYFNSSNVTLANNGGNGADGLAGSDGNVGGNADCDGPGPVNGATGGASVGACTGGTGGAGGYDTAAGSPGSPPLCGGGTGGGGGASGNNSSPGINGGAGAPGVDPGGGPGGSGLGSIIAGEWTPSFGIDGQNGGYGLPGGGGGGGGG
ncbi:MAG TPA: PKD domain-containing protein, partial [Candidatus Krumholzibacteria bacterium]|nr:PKD domain-containing protein [Candidatus Krumholzibacteria bacterium]